MNESFGEAIKEEIEEIEDEIKEKIEKHKKHKNVINPVFVIFIAIIIAILLVVLSFFGFSIFLWVALICILINVCSIFFGKAYSYLKELWKKNIIHTKVSQLF